MKRLVFLLLCFGTIGVMNAQWSELNTGITETLYSVSAVNDKVVWAAGNSGVVLLTTDGGNTWLNRGGGTVISATPIYNIYGIDSMNALAAGSGTNGDIYRTTDGGLTWTAVFSQPGAFIDAVWMFDAQRGVFYGDPIGGKWIIWRTTNAGATWDSTGTIADAPPLDVAGYNNAIWGDENDVYIGTGGTFILHSSDYGMTWESISTFTQANSYAIYLSDSANIYVGGDEIIKSSNAGTSWMAVTSPGIGSISGLSGTGDSLWMIRQGTNAGADSGVYRSLNGGTTWTREYTTITGGHLYHLTLARTGNSVWIAESNGNIVRGVLTPTAVNDQDFLVKNYSLQQNYPNPFNPSTNITYKLQAPGFVSLKVYDALGKEVAVLVNENKIAGTYSVNFNALNLPSGIYMYRLTAGNFIDVKKMTLIK